ncbi:hypothetical protein [Halonatronum saccharophilum]|uniref:hypothetical protein n=1 Tax=Halonatronum saccharophilum TaxID=150060 RepID=UPI00048729C5|nr:hypothetical protein [Halonatronum saccharophilum]
MLGLIILSLTLAIITPILILKFKKKASINNKTRKTINEVNEEKKDKDKEKKSKKNKSKYFNNITYHGNFIDINNIDFFGEFSKSPNSIYTIAYSEYPRNDYVLLEESQLIAKGKINRPKSCLVANNGNFIISSWGVSSNLLALFSAFDKHNRPIIRKELKANIYTNLISEDGTWALCQTHKSKYEDHSKLLLFFNLAEGRLAWSDKLPDYPAEYNLDIKENTLTLDYRDKGFCKYNFTGELIEDTRVFEEDKTDKSKNEISEEEVNIDDPYQLFDDLEKVHKKELDELKEDQLNSALNKFKLLLKTEGIRSVKYRHARTYRYIAEIYLKLDKKRRALDNFEKALKVSKRVGVKRITKELKQELK